jgi:hypothetical protein
MLRATIRGPAGAGERPTHRMPLDDVRKAALIAI